MNGTIYAVWNFLLTVNMAVNSARGEGSFRVNASDKHLQFFQTMGSNLEEALVGQIETPFLLQKTISTSIFILYLPAEITKIDIFRKNQIRDFEMKTRRKN